MILIRKLEVAGYFVLIFFLSFLEVKITLLLGNNSDFLNAGLFLIARNICAIFMLWICIRFVLKIEIYVKVASRQIGEKGTRELIYGNLSMPVAAMFCGTCLRLFSESIPAFSLLVFGVVTIDGFGELFLSIVYITLPFVGIYWFVSRRISKISNHHLHKFYTYCRNVVENWKDLKFLDVKQIDALNKNLEQLSGKYLVSNNIALLHANSIRSYLEILAILILFSLDDGYQSIASAYILYRLATTAVNQLGYISNLIQYYPQALTVREALRQNER